MRRTIPLLVVLWALAVTLTACGDDDDDGKAGRKPIPAVAVKGVEYAFAMPARVPGGLVSMDFSNAGRELHEYALARLDDGKTLKNLDAALKKKNAEPPAWVHDIGGVPVLTPGAQVRITRTLEPGTYVMLCFIPDPKGKPHYKRGMKKAFRVAGDSKAYPPRTDGTIVAGEKSYKLPKITAGRRTLQLRNGATKPREFNLIGLKPGKRLSDAQKFFASLSKGRGFKIRTEPPLQLLGAMQSIEPDSSVYLTATFKRGWRYLISDEENGIRAEFRPR